MTVVFWILVAFATVSSIFMAWSLGANSNSPPFAPAIGANAVSTMRAAFLIGILAAAGALTQGGAISETVGANLIDGVAITPLAAAAGLLVAAGFMSFGVYSGYPVPAAFATTGAIVATGAEVSAFGVVAVATINAVGGGALADILLDRPPFILFEDFYASCAVAGGVAYWLAGTLGAPPGIAAATCAAVTVGVRLLAVAYGWRLPTAGELDERISGRL